jgi:hypothetical protein
LSFTERIKILFGVDLKLSNIWPSPDVKDICAAKKDLSQYVSKACLGANPIKAFTSVSGR